MSFNYDIINDVQYISKFESQDINIDQNDKDDDTAKLMMQLKNVARQQSIQHLTKKRI